MHRDRRAYDCKDATMTIDMHSASGLRRWAMQCSAAANNPRASGGERDRLLAMRKALLELAEAQDWLDGRDSKSLRSDFGSQPRQRSA
jgi:hypothetical protein